jgi:hypothetical protein
LSSQLLGVKAAQSLTAQALACSLDQHLPRSNGPIELAVVKDAMTQANTAIRALYDED